MARKPAAPPRIGFVSLGCPKALVDSERILTRLRAEGYEVAPSYEGADLVRQNWSIIRIPNTIGLGLAFMGLLTPVGASLISDGAALAAGANSLRPLISRPAGGNARRRRRETRP